MKIYIIHASSYPGFRETLYGVFKKSDLYRKHSIIFPHENDDVVANSKKLISDCDLIFAEVSYPSIGLGIELGWAESARVNVLCIHKSDIKINPSINAVFTNVIAYSNPIEMIRKVEEYLCMI